MNEEKAQLATAADQIFYDVFKASPIGIAVEDMEGRPLFANAALCSMLGLSEEEMRNKHCTDFSPPEDAAKDGALFAQLRQGSIDHYHLEKRFFRKDGTLIWGRLSISLMQNAAGSHPLVVAMVADVTEKRAAEEKLRQSEAKLQMLTGQLIQAQEVERAWVARELHDDVSQRLVLLALNLDRLQQDLPPSAEFTHEIAKARKEVEDLGNDIQGLSHRLHSSKLEITGLARAAASFCKELSDRQKVQIDFYSENIPKELSKEVSLCLFRVLQEALQNAARHSGSRHFQVSLTVASDELYLIVRDSGSGFDPVEAVKGRGLGLTSMQERLKLVNGNLSISSQPHSGATIQARVPLTPRMESARTAE
jgi:PAS domain S-box-containing protein